METGKANSQVGAVVLAAGQSRRMGQPKLVMPWGEGHTVIQHIVLTLVDARIDEIIAVTGGARDAVEASLAGYPVKWAHNPEHEHSEMLTSLQVGIRALPETCQAALVVLGDQPTIEKEVINRVVDTFIDSHARLVVPSYQMHRGHPWLVERSLWPDLLDMSPELTMHDFIIAHKGDIRHVNVATPGILKDMDTPDDYRNLREGH